MGLPTFRYHPDPIATGSLKKSETICRCCGQQRGFVYVGPTYAAEELEEELCSWCIADGSAAEKFDALFVDDSPLADAGLDQSVIEEVTLRTPSYNGRQQEEWLSHCNDACEYHGLATVEELRTASDQTKDAWNKRGLLDWDESISGFASGKDISFYKFICRHCGQFLTASDFT